MSDEWEEYLESRSDEDLEAIQKQCYDHIERRRLGKLAKIPTRKLNSLTHQYKKKMDGKEVQIRASITLPVTIHYDDGAPCLSYPDTNTCYEVVSNYLEESSKVTKEIDKAKKEWAEFERRVYGVAEEYVIEEDDLWDFLESKM